MATPDKRPALQAVPLPAQAAKPATLPAPEPAPASASAPAATPPATPFYARPVFRLGAGLALAAGAYFTYDYITVGRFIVSTDDAYVRADMSVLASKVQGYVASIAVKDNTAVKAGDTLLLIDDGDYKIAVDAARAKIATQDATIARLGEQVNAQRAAIEQARAQITANEADVTRTAADLARTGTLAKSQYASVKTLDQARADAAKAVASVTSAKASLTAAEANLQVALAQKTEAERTRAELQTSLAKVERDLAFTRITAPFDGIVANRAAQAGDFVQPGSRLLALVPMNTLYAEANFKETQLNRMQPGQTAEIVVDALGGKKYTGVVESLAPASGSLFSLLPPENATGNFTKIVQRVPVRVKVPADAIRDGGLRAGLSVTVSVNTKSQTAAADHPATKP